MPRGLWSWLSLSSRACAPGLVNHCSMNRLCAMRIKPNESCSGCQFKCHILRVMPLLNRMEIYRELGFQAITKLA